jgi:hypothetical protein
MLSEIEKRAFYARAKVSQLSLESKWKFEIMELLAILQDKVTPELTAEEIQFLERNYPGKLKNYNRGVLRLCEVANLARDNELKFFLDTP